MTHEKQPQHVWIAVVAGIPLCADVVGGRGDQSKDEGLGDCRESQGFASSLRVMEAVSEQIQS